MKKKNYIILCLLLVTILSILSTNLLSNNKVHQIVHEENQKLVGNVTETRTLYTGETSVFKSTNSTITYCQSDKPSTVIAFVSGGECMIRGIAPTDGEVVVVAKDSTTQYTIKVSVSKKEGSNDGFQSDTSSNIIFAGGLNVDGSYTDFYDSNTVMSQLCTTYNITNETNKETNYGNDIYVSSYSATEACGNASAKFAAICLDPSKAGPTNTSVGAVSTYKVSSSIDTNTLLGKVTSYINTEIIGKKISAAQFINNASTDWRIASNIAIRVIDIFENGGSFSTSDALISHYYSYAEMAKLSVDQSNQKIKLGKSVNNNAIQSKIEVILSNALCAESIPSINKSAWNSCVSFGSDSKNNTIERIINSSEVIWQPDLIHYSIIYKGQLILPASVTGEVDFAANCTNGFECSNYTFTPEAPLSDGRQKYKFEVTINGSVSSTLPVTDTDRKNISIAVTAQGLNPLSDAYILKPTNGTNRQRLVLLNTAEPTVYLYFNGAPNCNIDAPALNYRNCTEANCSSFKPELFLKAGCCELIPKNSGYDYVYNKACASSSCVYSTFQNVCSANVNAGENTEYVVQEGVDANGEAKYSTCVIDVTKSDSDTKLDAAGNSLMVAEFEDNPYCDISCKEDWEFSLGSLGAFTGQNAVAAGTFFTLKNPLVVNGSRTCVTSYINYNGYLSQLTQHSRNVVNAYNRYVHAIANRAAIKSVADVTEADNLTIQSPGSFTTTEDEYCTETDSKKVVVNSWYDKKIYCKCHCDSHFQNINDPSRVYCMSSCESWSSSAYTNKSCKIKAYKTQTETRYFCKTTEKCTNFEFKTAVISHNKFSFSSGLSQSTENSDVFVNINTKEGTTEGITISGLKKFESGQTTITSTSSNNVLLKSEEGIIGSCPTKDLFTTIDNKTITNYVYSKVGTVYDSIIQSSQSTMISNTQQIKEKSEDMFACQHWQLYNAADEGNSNKVQNDILGANYMGTTSNANNWSRNYYTITSAFDPKIAYSYEEEEYMSMIGANNLLVEDTERNDIAACNGTTKGCFDKSKSVTNGVTKYLSDNNTLKNTCYTYNYKIELPDGTFKDASSEVCHNNIQAWYYNTGTPWNPNSTEAKKYEAAGNTAMQESSHPIALCTITSGNIYEMGKNGSIVITKAPDNKFHGGTCTMNHMAYIKANYIKQTITDGSIYKITGKWYKKDGVDTKSFSSDGTKETAMRAVGDSLDLENKSYWSPIGTHATFPIKISTRRNMYQYLFSFGYIGSFSNGSLGRIMGTSTSIIKVNNTACFYEVYEELCICCGYPIDSKIETYTGISTTDYIKQNNIDYKESDYKKISKKADLGFYFSTISLNDIDTDTNRTLADNWKTTKYMINGYDNHTSTKGEELAKDIKAVGENIYNITPEYAFNLTPTAMSEIREYNDRYGYEVDLKTLIPYGLVSTEPLNNCYGDVDNCDWGLDRVNAFDKGDYISFVHYGSKLLEGEIPGRSLKLKQYWKNHKNDLLESKKVCAIFEDEYQRNIGKSNNKTALQDLVDSGCRWIDYIDEDNNQMTGSNQYYRLSFK